jgi:lysophospholipase L1-like esterase
MQIHELDNYSGSLDSGAYIAVDNGADTGKVSIKQVTDPLNNRINNIIAGPSSSAQEVIDARLGADGVTYPSLGDAIRDQVTNLKSAISNFEKGIIYPSIIKNVYIDKTDGSEDAYNNWGATDYIDVSDNKPMKVYSPAGSIYNAFYDSEKVFISAFSLTAGINTVSVPQNATYVRMSNTLNQIAQTYYEWSFTKELESMALKEYGSNITAAVVSSMGYSALIDFPVGYAYAITPSVSLPDVPQKLKGASFTFISVPSKSSRTDYTVYLAVGRDALYYGLRYANDTAIRWTEASNSDATLSLRWGTTAEIVLLGDSIVQGVGSSDYSSTGEVIATIDGTEYKRNVGNKSWGARFKEYIESSYYGLTVINNGLAGQGIQVINENIDSLVGTDTKVAIVCAGVNNRTSSASTIQNYYEQLFASLQSKDIKVLALSPIDVNGATFNTSMALVNTALERACLNYGVPYFNLYGEYNAVLNANTKADYYNDTLHPNDKGYATMFGLICKLLNF